MFNNYSHTEMDFVIIRLILRLAINPHKDICMTVDCSKVAAWTEKACRAPIRLPPRTTDDCLSAPKILPQFSSISRSPNPDRRVLGCPIRRRIPAVGLVCGNCVRTLHSLHDLHFQDCTAEGFL